MESVAEQFAVFLAQLHPSPEELAAARETAATAGAVLRAHFRPDVSSTGPDFLVAGSIGKRTATRPLPPVDLIYLLPRRYPTPASALAEVALAVAGEVSGDAVCLAGGRVRVLPALEHGNAYLIPVAGRWRASNPAAEVAALRLIDGLGGGLATRLLMLLRAWRDANAVALASFELENLVREFVTQEAPVPGDFVAALTEFFVWSRRFTPCRLELPGGRARLEIDAAWHGAAEAAYWRCVLAQRASAAGDHAAATEEWRRLLGSAFPAPAAPWNSRRLLG